MYRFMTAAGCAALGWLIAQPAMAACSLSTQPITVTFAASLPMIDVKVDGKPAHFMLDSAAPVNEMSSKLASSQKLTATKVSTSSVVKAPQFDFAGATLKDVPFVVSDRADGADGVIGQTFLHQGDVEYDLENSAPAAAPSGGGGRRGGGGAPSATATGTVRLAKAVGCEGSNMAYWAKEGDTFYEAALAPAADGAPYTETIVTVNGVKLRARLATAKLYTTITEKAAAKAGVKTSDAGVKTLMSGKSWMAPFNSVIVGNEEIKNEPLEIIGDAKDDSFDILLGADFFAAHHLYVANSQQKIYFTRANANTPVFKVHPPEASGMQLDAGRELH